MSKVDSITSPVQGKPNKPYPDFPSFPTQRGAGQRKSVASCITSVRGPTPTRPSQSTWIKRRSSLWPEAPTRSPSIDDQGVGQMHSSPTNNLYAMLASCLLERG